MNNEQEHNDGAGQPVRCSAWLGRRILMLTHSLRGGRRKPGDGSTRPLLGSVDDAGNNLGVVRNYPGAMSVLIDAMKKKGVRFDELSFEHGDITYQNQNVVVLRGAAYEVVHRAFKGEPRRIPRKERWQGYLRGVRLCLARHLGCFKLSGEFKVVHKRASRPNESSSATRPPNA